jgi:cytochrome c-type biogenesis protein CcmE
VKTRRGTFFFLLPLAGGAALLIALALLGPNLSYFRTPTDIVTENDAGKNDGKDFRLGGLVEQGSLRHDANGPVRFRVTDLKNTVAVRYDGLLPDLFREGQGVVADGHVDADGVFAATTLLAKHDETYMPPDVARVRGLPVSSLVSSLVTAQPQGAAQ